MSKHFYVYVLTDPKHRILYTGVTANLQERIYQHKEKLIPGFTSRYNTDILVYYEEQADAPSAIARESRSKADPGRRRSI